MEKKILEELENNPALEVEEDELPQDDLDNNEQDDTEVEYEDFGADLNSSIEMFFHKTSLSGSDFYPEIGDVVDWNDFYWEIDGTSEPQLLQGHWDFKHQVKATAHRTRLSSVTFDERKM